MTVLAEWDFLDAGAPRHVAVPFVRGPYCWAKSPHGLVCTRALNHHGRHLAAGSHPLWDQVSRQVYAVWGDR